MEITLREHLLEKYPKQSDENFSFSNRIEKSKNVIRLLLEILTLEQESVFNQIPIVNENQVIFDQCENDSETEFFPVAASTCAFGAVKTRKVERNPIIPTSGGAIPFTIDQNSVNYVPDTCVIDGDDNVETCIDTKMADFTIVPETQDAFPGLETKDDSNIKNVQGTNLERRVQNFDTICPDITENFGILKHSPEFKPEKKNEEQLRDEAIREKYPPLSFSTKSTTSNSTENSSITISDCDSPSVLSSISKSAKRKRNQMNFNDDDDDFKTPLITSCDEPKRKKRPGIQSTSSKVKPATNSYGMTVTVATESQVPRMKQSSIKDILAAANKGRNSLKKEINNDEDEDEDFQRAVKESLKETCLVNQNDSFDDYEEEASDENAWKYANIPVKKKSDREKLKGFSCANCEEYYRNANLTEKQRQELVQKCSRHRSTIEPPPSSPKEMWEVEIDGPDNKTQYEYSPLKRRDRSKLSRLTRK